MHRHYFEQARDLATRDVGRPRQVNLRRAVSSTYYALFHALINEASKAMFGAGHAEAPFRQVFGRAFNHGAMKQACASFAGGTLKASVAKGLPAGFSVPEPIRTVARSFVYHQDQRHLADYDFTERFRRSDVLTLADQAESALNAFLTLSPSVEKTFFLACLLAWPALASR